MICSYNLNFTVITNDDNIILITLVGKYTQLPVVLDGASAVVTIYLPGTTTPVLEYTNATIVGHDGLQFIIPHTDVASLSAGNYGIVIVVTMDDGSIHTVNNGDMDLTTGIMKVVKRPPGG